jgi:hypothetical protein
MKRWLLLVCLSCVGVACARSASVNPDISVDEVSIRSVWGGYSPDSPLITELVYKRSGDGFTLTGTNSRAARTGSGSLSSLI